MSDRRKKRKAKAKPYNDVQLNIMPFIDIFSLLNTFLLYSAVFLALGVIEVQIPFLSNAAPPSKEARVFSVNVEVLKDSKVEVVTSFSQPPTGESKWMFDLTEPGMSELHKRMVSIRKEQPETDKVTLFSDNEVTFKQLTMVLDAVKLRLEADPQIFTKEQVSKGVRTNEFVFPKVVMGSVMLKGG